MSIRDENTGRFKVQRGFVLTKKGYLRYTAGPHRNKLVHRVVKEEHLGRPLERDEDVNHIDRNKINNDISNLEVLGHKEHGFVSSLQRWYVTNVVEPKEKREWDEYFDQQGEPAC